MKLSKSFITKVIKRVMDAGILVYAAILVMVVITGGFETRILGVGIKANHLYTPLKILIPLIFLRLLLTVRIREFLLLIVSLLVSLGFIEIVVRLWNPPLAKPQLVQIHKASSVLGWELIPGSYGIGGLGEVYRINTKGFRDKEYPTDKAGRQFRIAVMGDSFTFGAGVNLEDTYPKQMERILKSKGIHADVMNFGVIGYNMWQFNEMLLRKVLPFHPDLVVLGLFQNDLLMSRSPYTHPDEWQGMNPFETKGVPGVLSRLYLWNFLLNANMILEYKYRYRLGQSYLKDIKERKKTWGPSNPTDENYRIMSGKYDKEKYSEFSKALQKFVSSASQAQSKVLVVLIPDSVQLHDPHMQAVNRFVDGLCRTLQIPFLDLTPFLEAEKDPASLYLFPIDAHNSPKGLRLIAEAIVRQGASDGLWPFQGSVVQDSS